MIRVLIFRQSPNGSLNRVTAVDVPDTSTQPEADAWRTASRDRALGTGTFQVMQAGRRYSVEEVTSLKTTDLGAAT